MDVYEYWIGYNTDYRAIWDAYEEGGGYIEKFHSMRVHLLRIELRQFPSDLPLFNHEAVYKTIKGYFHDLKLYGLSEEEYGSAGPLFLYSVDRGSGIWNFLGELQPLIALAIAFAAGKNLHQELRNIDDKLRIIQNFFPDANPDDIKRLLQANSQPALQFAIDKLTEQGMSGLKVSRKPFNGNFKEAEQSLSDFMNLTVNQYFGSQEATTGIRIQKNTVNADGAGFITIGDHNILQDVTAKTRVTPYQGRDDLGRLMHELSELREILHGQAVDARHDVDLGQIAAAEIAARSGDQRGALMHLKSVGAWVLDFATRVGASLTAEVIKRQMNL